MSSRFGFFKRLLVPLPLLFGLGIGIGASSTAAALLGSSIFSDVPAGMYYDAAVGEMYADGVIKGFEDGKFHPDEPVTRGQLALMLQRFKHGGNVPSSSSSSRSSSSSSVSSSSSSSSVSSSSSSSSSSISSIPAQGGLRFTAGAYTLGEGATSFPITVVRTAGKAGAITVDYKFVSGTAIEGQDFQATTGTISIGSGESSKVFQIVATNDTTPESEETFDIILSNPTGGAVILNDKTTIYITDDDGGSSSSGGSSVSSSSSSVTGPGTFGFAAGMYSVAENTSSITVTVTRTSGSIGTVGVSYTTTTGSNYTAVSGSDFASTSGTLSFAAGETSKSFTVPIVDDGTIDGNKTFAITLSNPTGGATIGTTSAQVTIYDEETAEFGSGTFRFASSTYVASESSGKAVVTVNRVGGSKGAVSVQYNTANGSALSGADYGATSGTLNFAAGEASKSFEIPLYKDSQANEGEETINLTIFGPVGAMLGDLTTATVTISG